MFSHKNTTKKRPKYLILLRFKPNVGKTTYTEKKSTLTSNIRQNLFIWKIQILIK